jgi:hypothetical protein
MKSVAGWRISAQDFQHLSSTIRVCTTVFHAPGSFLYCPAAQDTNTRRHGGSTRIHLQCLPFRRYNVDTFAGIINIASLQFGAQKNIDQVSFISLILATHLRECPSHEKFWRHCPFQKLSCFLFSFSGIFSVFSISKPPLF